MRVTRRKKGKTTQVKSWDGPGIFLTGALGDILAVMSFYKVPDNLKIVYYATSQFDAILPLIQWLCPTSVQHVNLWQDFSTRQAFYSLDEFCAVIKCDVPTNVIDLSILKVFHSDFKFVGSKWSAPIADLTRFRLPSKYAVLCPYARGNYGDYRNLNEQEILATLERVTIPVVVLHKGDDKEVQTEFNLQNRTTLFESIAILRGASACVTVDSALSVVAARFLPGKNLIVKSSNPHLLNHCKWYYPTHDSFEFVVPSIAEKLKELSWIN